MSIYDNSNKIGLFLDHEIFSVLTSVMMQQQMVVALWITGQPPAGIVLIFADLLELK